MGVITGQKNHEVLEYLLNRRSAKADDLVFPAPSPDEIIQILTAAMRVPDHGKMCPWYALVFEGEARTQAGEIFADIYHQKNPKAREDQIEDERNRFMRAPLVIGLVSRARRGKKPIWEQVLSAGAVGMNLSLAAHALGYGVQWMSEWVAYDADVKAALGIEDARDHVAGFFYIGSCPAVQPDRDRPDLSKVVTYWSPDAVLNKGDCYDVDKLGFPETAFDFSKLYAD